MLEVSGDADLAQETFGAEHRTEVGIQDLDRDLAVVANVMGEMDCRHPAGSERAF